MVKARHPHPHTAHPKPHAFSQGQLELTGATVAGAEASRVSEGNQPKVHYKLHVYRVHTLFK